MNKDFREWFMSDMEITEEDILEDGDEDSLFHEVAVNAYDGFRTMLELVEWAWYQGRAAGEKEAK